MAEILADDEFNCRGAIPYTDVAELARDIEQRGLVQPVTICNLPTEKQLANPGKKYLLLAGYRRFKAHIVLKRDTIEAIVETRPLTESQARILNLSENLQRRELNVMQEARAISQLFNLGLTEMSCAKELNVSRGWVQIRYMLLQLPELVQSEVEAGFITSTQIRELYTIYRFSGKDKCYDEVKRMKDAKLRGKTAKVKTKPVVENIKRKEKLEVFEMMEHIRLALGNEQSSLTRRALAWSLGEISDTEFKRCLFQHCSKLGLEYPHYNPEA
jgi:ParB/RepB/Spo0J family partition protein